MTSLFTMLFLAVALAKVRDIPPPLTRLVCWADADPEKSALAYANRSNGLAMLIAGTGSMEPLLYGGDWLVIDRDLSHYWKLQPGELVGYQVSWMPLHPASIVVHVTAAKSGEAWIMNGINNRHYERGDKCMTHAEYRGKVLRIYTRRPHL